MERLGDAVPSSVERVVAVEPGPDGVARLFIREVGGALRAEDVEFRPILLLADPALLVDSGVENTIEHLAGDAKFAWLAVFPDTKRHDAAVKYLRKHTGASPSAPSAPYKVFTDTTQRLLMGREFRLFRGMAFKEVRKLRFDIETLTTEGFEFPNPSRPEDRIAMISLADNTGWEECLVLEIPSDAAERKLLEEFVALVSARDPDTMEGHNIFKFDLPFIAARAKRLGVDLALGRELPWCEGRPTLKGRPSRMNIAERTINYVKYEISGRHVVDTFHLVQHYDVVTRELESFGLKSVARHFGVAAPDRTYVPPEEISALFRRDPERLRAYAMDDVRETASISDILAPSYFHQTQLVPLSYQNCVTRGSASKIEAMLVSAYLAAGESIPASEMSRPFAGGLTVAAETGVFNNVRHCDVRSLYPSIIISNKWTPSRDRLGAFSELLEKLRRFRLEAKDAAAASSSSGASDADTLASLQAAFKILINSFYGYLGFSQGSFNDFRLAEMVTAEGRGILEAMMDILRSQGAVVIEADTDGIYFQLPGDDGTSDSVSRIERRMAEELPTGIEVEMDALFPAMFCYKSKNYALSHSDGSVSITGAALKSRGLEPFQREYLARLLELILKHRGQGAAELTREFRGAIETRTIPLAKLAKTEELRESVENYRKKLAAGKGRRAAAYELADKSDLDFKQGDRVVFYVTGDKKRVSVVENSKLLRDAPIDGSRDENTAYYLAKLDDLAAKFADFIEEDDAADGIPDYDNPLGLEFN
jgi:DNA polymerase elongation subunit (family B)